MKVFETTVKIVIIGFGIFCLIGLAGNFIDMIYPNFVPNTLGK